MLTNAEARVDEVDADIELITLLTFMVMSAKLNLLLARLKKDVVKSKFNSSRIVAVVDNICLYCSTPVLTVDATA